MAYSVKIGLELDSGAIGRIKQEIQNALKNVPISPKIEVKDFNITSAVGKLNSKKIKMNSITVDRINATSAINNFSKSIQQSVNSSLKSMNFAGLQTFQRETKSTVNGIFTDINKLSSTVKNSFKSLSGIKDVGFSYNLDSRTKDLQDFVVSLKHVNGEILKLKYVAQEDGSFGFLSAFGNESNTGFKNLTNLLKQISSMETKLSGLKTSPDVNTESIKNLEAELDKLYQKYTKTFNNIKNSLTNDQMQELESLNTSAANKLLMAESTAKQKINNNTFKDLVAQAKEISKLRIAIEKTPEGSSSYSNLVKDLGKAKEAYKELRSKINSFTPQQKKSLDSVFANTESQIRRIRSAIKDSQQALARGVQNNLSNGSYTSQIDKLEASISKLSNFTTGLKQAKTDLQALKTVFNELQNASTSGDINNIIKVANQYNSALKKVLNSLKSATAEQQKFLNGQRLDNQKTLFTSKIDTWIAKNTRAAKEFSSALESIKARIQDADAVQLNNLKTEFKSTTDQAQAMGLTGSSISRLFKGAFNAAVSWGITSEAIGKAHEMFDNVVKVDTAMTELRRVSNLSENEYTKMYENMAQSAKTYGVELDTLINSTASWVRLGFDPNTSNRLAEITAMYQHVTDLDESTAVNNLVTAYKGFEDQLMTAFNGDEAAAVERIADIYDKLGNEFAVGAEDVGSGLSRSASTLSEAGNTIEQSAAMVTGITEVTQDPEKAGTGLKILALRLRGMKGELQELGEEVDGNVESISKMQTQVLNLTGGKVNIFDENGDFRSTYDIINDIAEVFDTLSDTDAADLLETIAGKNRANDVMSLIKNWDNVKKAYEASLNASGTAATENEIYLDSLEGRINTLKATWQEFSNTFLSSDFAKQGVEGLTSIINGIDGITESIGSLGVASTAGGLYALIKNLDRPLRVVY